MRGCSTRPGTTAKARQLENLRTGRQTGRRSPASLEGRSDPGELESGVGDHRQRIKANKATEAVVAADPGGSVDRVVKLSYGE